MERKDIYCWFRPRGIVAASAATFFTVELEAFGVEGREIIRSMVFLTVLITVIVEGVGAKYMANFLNLAPKSVLIVGGGSIGQRIGPYKYKAVKKVLLSLKMMKKVDQLLKEGLYVIQSDATNEKTYSNISINNIKSLITTAEDDWLNLRVCQIVKAKS